MKNRKLIGIMATDPQGVIGNLGKLPWHYPEETKHFQQTVKNHIIVMGYKTFIDTPQSLLKTTINVVFTQHHQDEATPPNTYFVSSLEQFFQLPLPNDKKCFVIGGAQLITLFLKHHLIDEFILTLIHKSYPGDCFFPLSLLHDWKKHQLRTTKDFSIYLYTPNH